MKSVIEIKDLKPSEIVGIKMDRNRILHIWFNYPVLNADVDYETALYASREQKRLEKINGESLGLFMNITDYNRLDCVDFFGISLPSTKVRKVHYNLFKNAKLKRIAVYKKEAPRVVEVCAKMVMLTQGKEVKVFSDSKKALDWLEEGAKQFIESDSN